MESVAPRSTPMFSVWKVVIGTMIATVFVSALWHFMTLSKMRARNAHEENAVRLNIVKLTAYRDVVKEKGLEGAKIYLEQHQ